MSRARFAAAVLGISEAEAEARYAQMQQLATVQLYAALLAEADSI